MRALKILALVLVPLAGLAVCDQNRSRHGRPRRCRPAYDTSPDANTRFLADYAARPDVKKLPDGLMYRVLQVRATVPSAQKNTDVATVYYKGSLINGKVFDQTKPEEPAPLQVGGVIPGWTEALKLMKTGDTWELVIPSDLAYGSEASATPFRPTRPWSSCEPGESRIRAIAGKSVFAYKTASKSGETMRFLKVLVLVPLVALDGLRPEEIRMPPRRRHGGLDL